MSFCFFIPTANKTNGSQGYKQKQTNKNKFILIKKERQKSREEREEREIKYFYIICWYWLQCVLFYRLYFVAYVMWAFILNDFFFFFLILFKFSCR